MQLFARKGVEQLQAEAEAGAAADKRLKNAAEFLARFG